MPLARASAPVAAPAGPRRRVLVAEDNATNRLVVTRMLERLGYRAVTVENGREAVEAVRAGGHDAVLMDVMMPEMDGLAATAAIRELGGAAAAIPIIGLTANAMQDSEARCLAAGMTHFEAKPISAARLGEVLARVLGDAAPAPAAPPAPAVQVEAGRLDQLARDVGVETTLRLIRHFSQHMPVQLAGIAAGGSTDATALARLARTARELGLPGVAAACDRLAAAPPEALDDRLRDAEMALHAAIDQLRAWRPDGWSGARSAELA
jgi:CheY-like chemotaxis protein